MEKLNPKKFKFSVKQEQRFLLPVQASPHSMGEGSGQGPECRAHLSLPNPSQAWNFRLGLSGNESDSYP